jgi:hypothetical protein
MRSHLDPMLKQSGDSRGISKKQVKEGEGQHIKRRGGHDLPTKWGKPSCQE